MAKKRSSTQKASKTKCKLIYIGEIAHKEIWEVDRERTNATVKAWEPTEHRITKKEFDGLFKLPIFKSAKRAAEMAKELLQNSQEEVTESDLEETLKIEVTHPGLYIKYKHMDRYDTVVKIEIIGDRLVKLHWPTEPNIPNNPAEESTSDEE